LFATSAAKEFAPETDGTVIVTALPDIVMPMFCRVSNDVSAPYVP
jgi:hypothetical protein